MPTYEYKCSKCQKIKDVIHKYDELKSPSKETITEITCCKKRMTEGLWSGEANNVVTADTRNIVARSQQNN